MRAIDVHVHPSTRGLDYDAYASGYLAEQLPDIFQRAIKGRLQDKALFGTDFPYVDLEKALSSFEKLDLKDAVKEKILFSNSQALFRL